MATSGNHRPRTRVTSAGRPPWDLPPPPAAPDPEQAPAPGPARPARRSWWWVLPFCGGALAVIVVAAVVIAIRPAGRTPIRPPRTRRPTRPRCQLRCSPARCSPG